jgi:MerR family copper efflux transcriptional regulator
MDLGTASERTDGFGTDRRAMHIGELCDRVALSQRTVRYYEEVGLVVPESRSKGGFRIYSRHHVTRLLVIKQMKPLGFSLEDMRAVLDSLDRAGADDLRPEEAGELRPRLRLHAESVAERRAALEEQLEAADRLAATLDAAAARLTGATAL